MRAAHSAQYVGSQDVGNDRCDQKIADHAVKASLVRVMHILHQYMLMLQSGKERHDPRAGWEALDLRKVHQVDPVG